jgi:hypothetical protein
VSKEHDATRKGVQDAWDFWLSQHDISTPETIELAVRDAFKQWLNAEFDPEDLVSATGLVNLGTGSVVSTAPALPGHVALVAWHKGNEGPAGATERFPVMGWSTVVYGLDGDGRALTHIEPMFVCNEVVSTASGLAHAANVAVYPA